MGERMSHRSRCPEGIGRRRTRVGRVVVELALLHPLEAKRVPAQRRVRHELRLELAVGERHLPASEAGAAIGCISPNRRFARLLFSAGVRDARGSMLNMIIIIVIIVTIITYY